MLATAGTVCWEARSGAAITEKVMEARVHRVRQLGRLPGGGGL